MLRSKASRAFLDVLWQNIVGISLGRTFLDCEAERLWPWADVELRQSTVLERSRMHSSSKEACNSSSSSWPLPNVMFLNLLQRTGVALDVDWCRPGRHRFTSLKISESLVGTFFFGEIEIATTAACFCARWNLQRKEPGWFVGEHIHVIFTGVEDRFDPSVEVGSRLSGDNDRLEDGPSVVVGALPRFVCRERGRKTALRSFEAFMMTPLPDKKQLHRKLRQRLPGTIALANPKRFSFNELSYTA